MSYATVDDLKNKLEESELIMLTDDNGTGAINTGVVDAALEAADVEIDSSLAKRYTLPLATVPKIIKYTAADLAIIKLFNRRSGPPDHWSDVWQGIKNFLNQLGDGEITLGVEDPEIDSSDQVQVNSSERQFSEEELDKF
ncbi:MAG: DUF1320 domain-containing protein [Desulfobulbaceae bacterium]|nr:DUF1320 domain-containing protein [Desulfobulbaceae bacterium]